MTDYEIIELGGGVTVMCHPNLDVIDAATVDIKCDLSNGVIPLDDNSVNKIVSRDFVEHLYFTDFINLLHECKRILKDGGSIDFITPDVDRALLTYSEWNEHVKHCVAGAWHDDNVFMRHKQWWTPPLMLYILGKEGWRDAKWEYYKKDPDWWKEPKFRVTAIK